MYPTDDAVKKVVGWNRAASEMDDAAREMSRFIIEFGDRPGLHFTQNRVPQRTANRGQKNRHIAVGGFYGSTLTVLLLDIQRIFGKDNAGIIGVEMVAGEEGHAAGVTRTSLLPMPSPAAPTGMAAMA